MPRRNPKVAAREQRQADRQRSRQESSLRRLTESQPPKRSAPARREPVRPLNDAQRLYDAKIREADIVFGIGPAGTGKTWLAAMRAGEMLRDGVIDKIIVTRPTVEVGETLGFLPGELEEKNEPYFRPVRDALEELFGQSHLEYLIRNEQIEARPLQLLRGATLKHCWVIADEMQNATRTQFKMLLTRIGEGAKFILNGDPRQTDLAAGQSGLEDALARVGRIGGVGIVKFTVDDIVRHGLVQEIVEAYENPS